MKGHILGVRNLTTTETEQLFDLARSLKHDRHTRQPAPLRGLSIGLLFQYPSLRTKASFDIAIHELGAHPVYFNNEEVRMGTRETPEDVARVLSRYVAAIVARLRSHKELERFAAASTVPVINALTDFEHPCQALADLLTIKEVFGSLKGNHLAFVGDADNNVATSLLLIAPKLGVRFTLIAPHGYQPRAAVLQQAIADGNALVTVVDTPDQADLASVNILYTDVWVSMGQEEEQHRRKEDLRDYQINHALLCRCRSDCIVLHCLPAKRGQEITSDVLEGPHSRVFDQAENRLHIQKALLQMVLAKE
ncbi:MAG: ornithine carbamoyltransferase [Chloroflexi bacterium]|nr:ornithine carbamoyltransferase [Chloroflexota bacterium]